MSHFTVKGNGHLTCTSTGSFTVQEPAVEGVVGGGSSGGGGSGYAFADKAELVTAVTAWTGTAEEKAAAADAYGDISTWDVSAVTDMSELFKNKSTFNDDISGWNTANVTTMRSMFELAEVFDQDISGWNTGNVTDMGKMFRVARVFNQDIGGWDVAGVTNMEEMFYWNVKFNQDISGWNVSNVTTIASMFRNSYAFNQPIGQWGNKTSNVTKMHHTFFQATSFDQDISAWDVSSVDYFDSMFAYAAAFDNGGQDMSAWDIGATPNHNQNKMFAYATSFARDLEAWGPKLARSGGSDSMDEMFRGATDFLALYPNGPTGWGNPPTGLLSGGDATATNWLAPS